MDEEYITFICFLSAGCRGTGISHKNSAQRTRSREVRCFKNETWNSNSSPTHHLRPRQSLTLLSSERKRTRPRVPQSDMDWNKHSYSSVPFQGRTPPPPPPFAPSSNASNRRTTANTRVGFSQVDVEAAKSLSELSQTTTAPRQNSQQSLVMDRQQNAYWTQTSGITPSPGYVSYNPQLQYPFPRFPANMEQQQPERRERAQTFSGMSAPRPVLPPRYSLPPSMLMSYFPIQNRSIELSSAPSNSWESTDGDHTSEEPNCTCLCPPFPLLIGS